MNRHLSLPLALLLLAGTASTQEGAGLAPPAGQETRAPKTLEEIPKAAPRAPLAPDPADKIKKPIQAALNDWFRNDPGIPGKKPPTEVQGERQSAAGRLEKACMEWNALIGAGGATWGSLRNVAWWKARMDETHSKENRTGKIEKIDFSYRVQGQEKKFPLAVSVPKSYRGNGTEVYPLILTCIDKDADPKKVFPAIYGPLLETHVVVASFENNLKDTEGRDVGGMMFYGVYWAETNVRIDRDRVVLDALGKGARFIDELAGDMALQWNGAVFRNPTAAPELIGNIALFPCCAILPSGAPETMAKAVDAIVAASPSPPSLVATGAADDATVLASVQQWIGALKPRKVSDQREPYTYWMRSRGRAHWGYWFTKLNAVDATTENPTIKVSVSRDVERNAVLLETTNLYEGEILLNDEVLDLDQPVSILVNGILVNTPEKPVRSLMTTFHAGDGLLQGKFGPRNYFITAKIRFLVTGDALIPESERKALADAKARAIEEERKRAEAPKEGDPAESHPKEAAPSEAPPAEAPKAPAPGDGAGAPPPTPVAPTATTWGGDYAAALAAAKTEGKALLVHFAGAAEAPGQAAVDKALGDASLTADLLRYVCVKLAVDGDAGKDAKARLERIAAGAAAPLLAVLKTDDESVTGKFAAATAKEEEVLPEIKKLVAPPPPPPPPPTPPVDKPKDEVKKDAPAETPKAEEKKDDSKR